MATPPSFETLSSGGRCFPCPPVVSPAPSLPRLYVLLEVRRSLSQASTSVGIDSRAGRSVKGLGLGQSRGCPHTNPKPNIPSHATPEVMAGQAASQSLASKTVGSSALGLRLRWGGAWMPSESKTAWAQGAAPPESDRWATPMPQHQDSLTRRTPSFLHL